MCVFIECVYLSPWAHVCTNANTQMWRPQDSSYKSTLSFYWMSSEDQTRVIRFGSHLGNLACFYYHNLMGPSESLSLDFVS